MQTVRRRVDRGSIRASLQGNVRRIPRSELVRVGLLRDGADTAEVQQLRQELRALRGLPRQVQLERDTAARMEQALHRERAERLAAEQRLGQLANAGFFARRRLLRQLRRP